jgi:poly-beta-1,6 N-acetyl-D-glucosamine synthase
VNHFLSIFIQILTLYPIIGAIAWTIGGILYRTLYVGKFLDKDFERNSKEEEPYITIMIPCHNEEVMIEETIDYLMNEIDYHNYEVLVCDDGSTDTTPDILSRLRRKYSKLRVLRVNENKGKAHAFNIGISFCKGEYVLSNDADTVPAPDGLWKYMNYFLNSGGGNIGAVTANMDVQNRSLLVEKSQTIEFSSIVGIIKRSQMGVLGNMYAYSGANTMYRKDAIFDCGGFRQDRATEDISIAWDQQFNGWRAIFAPDIMFYMNVPNTFNMLYHQRKRWAKGGTEAWITNFVRIMKHPIKNLPKIVMLLDQTGSILWSFYYLIFTLWPIITLFYFIIINDSEQFIHTLDMVFVFSAFISMVGIW